MECCDFVVEALDLVEDLNHGFWDSEVKCLLGLGFLGFCWVFHSFVGLKIGPLVRHGLDNAGVFAGY